MATRNQSAEDRWRRFTWDDLSAWVGSRSLQRGRSYQRSGRVGQLARTADGALLAWVRGTNRYATRVALQDEDDGTGLTSRCSCPIGGNCKHAAAVAVAYLEALKDGRDVPAVSASDPRLRLLDEGGQANDFDEEDFDEEGAEEWDEEESAPVVRQGKRSRRESATGPRPSDVRSYLEGQSAADLVAYVLGLAQDYAEIKRDLQTRATLAGGRAGDMIRQARQEIRRLTAEPAWTNRWNGEGSLPDYTGLKRLFEQLLEMGQADALLDLGEALLEGGCRQVEQSHDEGETAGQIRYCLDVVFRAVPDSSRPEAQKILYAIDMGLRDGYDLCQDRNVVLDRDWPPQAWSAVADELARRLDDPPTSRGDDFSSHYQRDRLANRLIQALEQSGRQAEIIPLMEAEARVTGSYQRLVDTLIARRRTDEARRWALEGIERVGNQWPGIAAQLRECLRKMAEGKKDWPTVAAMRAEQFFNRPAVSTLRELEAAAKKAGCQEAVQAAAMRFLETGVQPTPAAPAAAPNAKPRRSGRGRAPAAQSAASSPWPLPELPSELRQDEARAAFRPAGPHFNVLLDLALEEQRPEDILRWYDAWRGDDQRRSGRSGGTGYEARVADAVARTHPDRAAELYRNIIETSVAQTSPSAYEAALPYLRKLRALLDKLGRSEEWGSYLARLRETERRKRRFMEVLDRLESRPILEG
jgi:uncharacterized Zn finger protein